MYNNSLTCVSFICSLVYLSDQATLIFNSYFTTLLSWCIRTFHVSKANFNRWRKYVFFFNSIPDKYKCLFEHRCGDVWLLITYHYIADARWVLQVSLWLSPVYFSWESRNVKNLSTQPPISPTPGPIFWPRTIFYPTPRPKYVALILPKHCSWGPSGFRWWAIIRGHCAIWWDMERREGG